MTRILFILALITVSVIIPNTAGTVPVADAAGIRCAVNWGAQPTYLTNDFGCKYDGPATIGGVPQGWTADVEGGKLQGGTVTVAGPLTLRLVSGDAPPTMSDSGNTPPPPIPANTQAGQVGARCAVNWGNSPTFLTSDQGCKYDGPPTLGGVPQGWTADVEGGKLPPGTVTVAGPLTLRLVSGDPPPIFSGETPALAPQAQSPAPSGDQTGTIIVSCPGTPDEAAAAFGAPSTSQFWNLLNEMPKGHVWKYKDGPTLVFNVPDNWTIDYPQGYGIGPGNRIQAFVFTARCGVPLDP